MTDKIPPSKTPLRQRLDAALRAKDLTLDDFWHNLGQERGIKGPSVRRAFDDYARGRIPHPSTRKKLEEAVKNVISKMGLSLVLKSEPLFYSLLDTPKRDDAENSRKDLSSVMVIAPTPPVPPDPQDLPEENENFDFGWTGASQKLGARPYMLSQLNDDGIFGALTLDSVGMLGMWPEGIPISNVKAEKLAHPFKLHATVEPVVRDLTSNYHGYAKFSVENWHGANSDDPILTLQGVAAPPDRVKVVHDNFGIVRDALGRSPGIFDIRGSQIPNWLALQVISTTSDEQKYILFNRRSNQRYYPGFWSTSWEEQVVIEKDDWSIEIALLRGLKEELVNDANSVGTAEIIGLFREFDLNPLTDKPKEVATAVDSVCTMGLAIYLPLQLKLTEVWSNWLRVRDHEFSDIVGVPATFANLETLVRSTPTLRFDMLDNPRFIPGTEESPVRLGEQPLHPTNRARVLLLMAKLYPKEFKEFVDRL